MLDGDTGEATDDPIAAGDERPEEVDSLSDEEYRSMFFSRGVGAEKVQCSRQEIAKAEVYYRKAGQA